MATPRTFDGDGISFTELGDVVVLMWSGDARLERARRATTQLERVMRERSDPIIAIQLVRSTSKPPDGPARAEAGHQLALLGSRLRRLITLPLGDAFWMSVVRAVLRAMTLLSRHSAVSAVVGSVDEAVAEVEKVRSPSTPPSAELRVLLTRLIA
ncbi:MAG: hypothetical protein Q8O67_11330 [Deltaproteobacteria bacterium]|nr:hypothetical protein [Deltaproteobacteria bacterium]